MTIFITVFILINIFAFLMMAIDKYRAINDKYRISEKTLLTTSLLLGSLGIYSGMKVFRHKTQKNLFRFGVPILLIIHMLLLLIIFKYKSVL